MLVADCCLNYCCSYFGIDKCSQIFFMTFMLNLLTLTIFGDLYLQSNNALTYEPNHLVSMSNFVDQLSEAVVQRVRFVWLTLMLDKWFYWVGSTAKAFESCEHICRSSLKITIYMTLASSKKEMVLTD